LSSQPILLSPHLPIERTQDGQRSPNPEKAQRFVTYLSNSIFANGTLISEQNLASAASAAPADEVAKLKKVKKLEAEVKKIPEKKRKGMMILSGFGLCGNG
jgi:hypothetical protein